MFDFTKFVIFKDVQIANYRKKILTLKVIANVPFYAEQKLFLVIYES